MFKLDNDFLVSLGLGNLPVDEKNRLLQMIYERLEMNVGMRLAEKMSDQQLDEFEGFIDRNDEAGALKWLEANFPNYKDVVAEELEKLKREVQNAAPQILAAAQTFPTQPGSSIPQGQTAPSPMPGQPAPQPGYAQPAPQYAQPSQPPQGYPYQPAAPSPGPQPGFAPQAPQQQPGYLQQQPSYPSAGGQMPPAAPGQNPGFTPGPTQPQSGTPQPQSPQNPGQFTPPPPGFMPPQQ